eukprot:scaffold11527_cov105-Skeletonema_dohrnii-CCMP3373.AAC.3
MKFITLVALLGLSVSNHALAAIPDDEELDQLSHQGSRLRGFYDFVKTTGDDDVTLPLNPTGCPPASQMQLLGNQCLGKTAPQRQTICCKSLGRSGKTQVWVQCWETCSTHPHDGSDFDSEDYDSEEYDSEDYDSEDFDSEDYDYDEVADAIN